MKSPKINSLMRWLVSLLLATSPAVATAQQRSATDPDSTETVKLNPFEVTGDSVGRYQAAESTSGGRVAINIQEATQSLIVVTSDLIGDLGALTLLDSLVYFAGMSRSSKSAPDERFSIRGFQITPQGGVLTDGLPIPLNAVGNLSFQGAVIDRIEVSLGVDSIVSPSAVPGGTINIVTKKPQFSNFGSASIQVGRYNTDQASLDINRLISPNLALRLISSGTRREDYAVGDIRGFDQLSALTYQFKNGSKATLQHRYNWTNALNSQGLFIDPSVGTNDHAFVLKGMPISAALNYSRETVRKARQHAVMFTFNSRLSERLSMHLAVAANRDASTTMEVTPSGTLGGAYDPRTGLYTPGFAYGPAPTFTPRPTQFNPMVNAAVIRDSNWPSKQFAAQNDYAYQIDGKTFESTTMAGVQGNWTETHTYGTSYTVPAFNIFTGDPAPMFVGNGSPRAETWNRNRSANLYLSEVLKLLDKKLIVNVSLAHNWAQIRTSSRSRPIPYYSQPAILFKNYGGLYKVTKNISLYYGHAESAQPQNPDIPNRRADLDRTSAEQDEGGAKFNFMNGKIFATVSYFHIKQNNFAVINQLNYSVPPPVPPLPSLYLNRVAHGWEFQVNGTLSEQWSTILSYTDFRNRDPNGLPIRSTAEQSGAAWFHFQGKERLKGFGFGVGFVYQAKSPGDIGSGLTAASTSTNPIPVQASFFVPASSLINISASYEWNKRWKASLFVDNALDEEYIKAATRRTTVVPGAPINPRLMVSYSF